MRRLLLALAVLVALLLALAAFVGAMRGTSAYGRAVETLAAWLFPEPPLPPDPGDPVTLGFGEGVAARVDPRFLSFAIDSSLVVGGRWWGRDAGVELGSGPRLDAPFDLGRPALAELARGLAPALLRVGGTEADRILYDLSGVSQDDLAAPPGFEYLLTRSIWEGIVGFTERAGLDLLFTLNAGPGPRGEDGAWLTGNAAELLDFARERGDRVAVWELGNEPNVFFALHGFGSRVSGEQYARDLRALRELVDEHFPGARTAGPATAYWPLIGELGAPLFDVTEEALRQAGDALDVVTWHYYPQQSRRCPEATRRAEPFAALRPAWLDDVHVWAEEVEALRDRHAPGRPIWMGEMGSAQCGGEPGVSDVYVDTLWWLDALGALSRRGQRVVVRQSLVGSHYALLTDDLRPRPDYWASLLWQRLMGERVLDVYAAPHTRWLRTYAHCAADGSGDVALLLVNAHRSESIRVGLNAAPGPGARLYLLDAADPLGPGIRLNGETLRYRAGQGLPPTPGRSHAEAALTLPPLASAFWVVQAPDTRCKR